MSVTNLISDVFSRLNIPRFQTNCQTHLINSQLICLRCFNGPFCQKCLQSHQCQIQDHQIMHQQKKQGDGHHTYQSQQFFQLFSKNKEKCIQMLSNAKKILSQKLGLTYHSVKFQINEQNEQTKTKKQGTVNEINRIIISQVNEIQERVKNEVEKNFLKVHSEFNKFYSQYETKIRKVLCQINPQKFRDRIKLLNSISAQYQNFQQQTQNLNSIYITKLRNQYKNDLFNKISNRLTEILALTQNSQTKAPDQNRINSNHSASKGIKQLKIQKQISLQIRQNFKTTSLVHLLIDSQTQIQDLQQTVKKQSIDSQTQIQNFQQTVKKQLIDSQTQIDTQINLKNELTTKNQCEQLSQRILSLQNIICNDLEVISMNQKRIKDFEFFIQIQKKKNTQLANRFLEMKVKYEEEKNKNQHNIHFIEENKPNLIKGLGYGLAQSLQNHKYKYQSPRQIKQIKGQSGKQVRGQLEFEHINKKQAEQARGNLRKGKLQEKLIIKKNKK